MNKSMPILLLIVHLFFGIFCNVVAQSEQLSYHNVRVGVAVFIVQDGKILLGLRKNSLGHETWGTPGGRLEYGESFENCAIREVLEETGLQISHARLYAITNDVFEEEQKHYVTIFMITDECFGDVQLLEPDKCEYWAWFDAQALPENLFLPLKNLVAMMQQQEEN